MHRISRPKIICLHFGAVFCAFLLGCGTPSRSDESATFPHQAQVVEKEDSLPILSNHDLREQAEKWEFVERAELCLPASDLVDGYTYHRPGPATLVLSKDSNDVTIQWSSLRLEDGVVWRPCEVMWMNGDLVEDNYEALSNYKAILVIDEHKYDFQNLIGTEVPQYNWVLEHSGLLLTESEKVYYYFEFMQACEACASYTVFPLYYDLAERSFTLCESFIGGCYPC
jgi:hypothetical protein